MYLLTKVRKDNISSLNANCGYCFWTSSTPFATLKSNATVV